MDTLLRFFFFFWPQTCVICRHDCTKQWRRTKRTSGPVEKSLTWVETREGAGGQYSGVDFTVGCFSPLCTCLGHHGQRRAACPCDEQTTLPPNAILIDCVITETNNCRDAARERRGACKHRHSISMKLWAVRQQAAMGGARLADTWCRTHLYHMSWGILWDVKYYTQTFLIRRI